jgi:glycosyltransferase involved in cell wall biosynthesis
MKDNNSELSNKKSPPKRIGIDLRMSGGSYGIGRYGIEITRAILEEDKDNQYILFVRTASEVQDSPFKKYPNVELVQADFRHYSFDEQWYFPKLLRKFNLDLVHFLNFNVPIFYRRPFVVTIHDLIHHKLPGNKKSRFLHRLAYRLVMRHAVLGSRKIITVSDYSKKDIIETFKVKPSKIAMIYEAAHPIPVSDSDIVSAWQRFGIVKPYIVFVGVMERKKNIQALALAFDVIREVYKLNIQLVLVGKEDSYYPEVVENVRKIKFRDDLVITGMVSDKDKYALYKGSQAFVSASAFEGFGLPGVEAMSMGIPLIVSNTEVFNEVYDNGAIYFDHLSPEDIAQKVSLILRDDKYRSLVANNAYARSQFFSWQKAAKETIAVYQEIIK